MPPDLSDEYRRLAEDCAAGARGARSPELRTALDRLAQNWLRLAQEAQRIEAESAESGKPD